MVPKGWSESYLGEVVTYKKGYAFNSSLYAEEGIRIVRISDTTRDSIHSDNPVFIAGGNVEGLEQYSLFENDIILSTVGSRPHLLDSMVGKAVKVPRSAHNSLLNQNLVKLIPKKTKITNEYLFSMLKKKEFIQFISNLVRGNANQVSITLADLFKYKFILPSLPEQKKIAQILSTWDKAISVTEKLLTNSQQQKKALMQQLLTGKKRLLDENGVRFNGKWEKKLLSDVADVYQPKTISQSMMSDSGYPVYGANGVIGFYQEFNHETEQIAVTCRGSTCGIVNWTQAKSWITGNAMVINTDNYSYVSKKFLFYTLNGSDLKYLISGSGQPQITGNIKTHIINLPCIEEQQKIATVLSAADAEIYTLEKKLACLRDEKKALMQQLLTGKRRVKIDEAVAA
ncbi:MULTISPECIES: restriction endonuclease subunit S [Enterobacteriaceae]|uniref:restriction endonuclease subunit S n=1 Tax=Enterobacteriaceae TaxID=543 RepID=UPI00131211DF|nr:restriction endonuclease subunit S [Escherichia coli]MWF49792.1 restriction endonuclease subunit S [Escherichia coli]